jgi:hypothetical protein
MRLLWSRHRQEYTDVVKGLQGGRFTVDRRGMLREPTPYGERPARPPALKDGTDEGPVPNVYFHVHVGNLLDWTTTGFLYTTATDKAIEKYWCGREPNWIRLAPHWYIVQN